MSLRALVSVHDKSGVVELAQGLVSLGWEVVSSGGTYRALVDAGVAVTSVEEVTGAAEMLGGRVKTLHPRIHGGILADRDVAGHMDDIAGQGIEPIDLVVCNLYPFRSDPGVELIDIGGPAMIRAAAKNFSAVGAVVDPADYPVVLAELRSDGALSGGTRRRLARRAFAHTSAYDAAIVAWFDGSAAGEEPFPPTLHLSLERADVLRYGENPHQSGARYRDIERPTWWDSVEQLSGLQPSYLNLFDTDAAWRLVHELWNSGRGDPCVVIVKHANPCGAAFGADLADAYRRALECDPVSAFGGIVALSGPVTEDVADAMVGAAQADVVIAPDYEARAVDKLIARRKNTRILRGTPPFESRLDLRKLDTGYLVQPHDVVTADRNAWRVVTKATPSDMQWSDLEMAVIVCARTTSNAIVVVNDRQAVGIGAGQQNRAESSRIAISKAADRVRGAVAASDAFFPFPDGLEILAGAGVTAVAQPGGSVRDEDVIEAADERGVAMVFTGERHFKH